MISKNLFDELLFEPGKIPCNKLFYVSGYATSAIAFHHLEEVYLINESI